MELDANKVIEVYKQKIGEQSHQIVLLESYVQQLVQENESLKNNNQNVKDAKVPAE